MTFLLCLVLSPTNCYMTSISYLSSRCRHLKEITMQAASNWTLSCNLKYMHFTSESLAETCASYDTIFCEAGQRWYKKRTWKSIWTFWIQLEVQLTRNGMSHFCDIMLKNNVITNNISEIQCLWKFVLFDYTIISYMKLLQFRLP